MKKITFSLIAMLALLLVSAVNSTAQRIYVEGTQFKVSGQQIFLSGTNTPWRGWNDFGIGRWEYGYWDAEFKELADNGVNSTRVWISCNGEGNPLQINSSGYVNGPTQAFWNDLDQLVEIAAKHKVYLMVALISFDHTIEGNPYYNEWRKMYSNQTNMNAFAENYALAVAKRYNNNPYFFAIDIVNEVIWVTESEQADRGTVPWTNIQYLFGKVAQRVHEETDVLVCASNYMKYTATNFQGNKYADNLLQAQVGDPDAYLDFYKIHYYSWVHPWFGGFHYEQNPSHWGFGDKPCITGEISANGAYKDDQWGNTTFDHSTTEMYKRHLNNGWAGVMPWTSNGVDINGSLDGAHGAAARYMRDNYYNLVYPSPNSCTVSLSKSTHDFGSGAGSTNVTVTTSESYSVSDNQSWISTSTSGSTVTISVTENTSTSSRSGTVTISGCETKTISVSQAGTDSPAQDAISITASPATATAGQTITVSVDYEAESTANRVRVELFKDLVNYQWYAGVQHDITSPASGSHDFSLTIPSSLADGDYKLFAVIKNGSTDIVSTSADITVGDVQVEYTLTVDGSVQGSYTAGTAVAVSEPSQDCKIFDGWDVTADCISEWTGTMPACDVALTSTFVDDPACGGTIEINDNDAAVSYSANWSSYSGSTQGQYEGDEHYSYTPGSTVTVEFTGTQIQIYTTVDAHHGTGTVTIDGGNTSTIDYAQSTREAQKLVYTSPVLSNGAHTMVITVDQWKSITSDKYVVTASGTETFDLTVDGSLQGSYAAGTTVAVATPSQDCKIFDGWDVTADCSSEWTGTMPACDVALTSTFVDDPACTNPEERYEAEDAQLTGVSTGSSISGYSGTGYIEASSFDNNGDKITFTANVSTAGNYDLIIGYSTQNLGGKYQTVSVNGATSSVQFPASTGWGTVTLSNQSLNAGNNTIEIIKSWGWTYIDYLEVSALKSATVNALSNANTLNVYPNPVEGNSFYIQSQQAGIVEFYNTQGKLVHTEYINIGNNAISSGQLQNGMYIVKMNSEFSKLIVR